MEKKDGMTYAPKGKSKPVVKEREFVFSVIGLDHGHIYGMTNGLLESGATLKYVFDEDIEKAKKFKETYPKCIIASSIEEILKDNETLLVASALVPCQRALFGVKVMQHGKHYFTDKTGCTKLEDLALVEEAYRTTKKRFFVYFSERLHVESAVFAEELIKNNAIGKVVQVIGLGPHRLNAETRPNWFFNHQEYGGILCDIGSHQIEQFLFFSGANNAVITDSKVGNYNHPQYKELEDFGDCSLIGDNGAIGYFRVDWFTPDALGSWGDGRLFILGTKGYIELRKYINVGTENSSDHLFLINDLEEKHYHVAGKTGYPFFGKLILDCLNDTEYAMSQEHIFTTCRLCIMAQLKAKIV